MHERAAELAGVINAHFPSYMALRISRDTLDEDRSELYTRLGLSQERRGFLEQDIAAAFRDKTVNYIFIMANRHTSDLQPIAIPTNIEDDGVTPSMISGDGRGHDGANAEHYLATISQARPSELVECIPVELPVMAMMERSYARGNLSREALAFARAGFDADAMSSRDGLITGHSVKVLQQWIDNISNNKDMQSKLPPMISIDTLRRVLSVPLDWSTLTGGLGALVSKKKSIRKYSELKGLDKREIVRDLIKFGMESIEKKRMDMLNELYPFDCGSNEDHAGYKLGQTVKQLMKHSEWWEDVTKEALLIQASGSCTDLATGITWGSKLQVIEDLLYEMSALPNDVVASFLWTAASSGDAFLTVLCLKELNMLKQSKQVLAKHLKALTGIAKKWRLSLTQCKAEMSAKEYGRVSYMTALSGRGGHKMEVREELELRSHTRREPIAFDEKKGLFTHAKAREIKMRSNEDAYGFSNMEAENNTIYLNDVVTLWRSRQNWLSNGAAAGFNAAYPASKEGVVDPEEISALAYRSMVAWEAAMLRRCDSAPGSSAAAGLKVDGDNYRGAKLDRIGMKKRAALERVLWSTIQEVVKNHCGSFQATSVIKGEAGASRLLLTQDVLSYVVLSLLFSTVRPRLGRTKSIDSGRNVLEELAWLQWRTGAVRRTYETQLEGIRNFDFSNYNIQHTVCTLSLDLLSAGQAFCGTAGESYVDRREIHLSGIGHWVAHAAARTTIRWTKEVLEADNLSLKEAAKIGGGTVVSGHVATPAHTGLNSGTANTAECNSGNNRSDTEIGVQTVLAVFEGHKDETDRSEIMLEAAYKGDDSEASVAALHVLGSSWLTSVTIDRSMAYAGADAQPGKCMNSGWAEWQKALHSEVGEICGSVPRTISTFCVSSWQNAPNRCPIEGCPAGLLLISLMARRGMLRSCGVAMSEGWLERWGRVGLRDFSQRDDQGRVRIVRWQKLPLAYFYSPSHLRGELLDAQPLIMDLPAWCRCRAPRARLLDDAMECGCGHCHKVAVLPAMPQRPLKQGGPLAVLRAMGSEMTRDFRKMLLRNEAVREHATSKEVSNVLVSAIQSNYGDVMPGQTRMGVERSNLGRDYAWAFVLAKWNKHARAWISDTLDLEELERDIAACESEIVFNLKASESDSMVMAAREALRQALVPFRSINHVERPLVQMNRIDLDVVVADLLSIIDSVIIAPFELDAAKVNLRNVHRFKTTFGLIGANKTGSTELATVMLEREIHHADVSHGSAVTTAILNMGPAFMSTADIERAAPVLNVMQGKAALRWVLGDYRYASAPAGLATLFVSVTNSLMLYITEVHLVRLSAATQQFVAATTVEFLLDVLTNAGYGHLMQSQVVLTKCGL